MLPRAIRIPLVLVLLLVATSPALGQAPAARIVVDGKGEVTRPPDRAEIRLAIETRAQEPAAAAASNAERQQAVLQALRDAGVREGDVATIGYGVQPEWQWREGERFLDGYVARTGLQIRTAELDRVGTWIDTAIGAGADQIESVSFGLSDPLAVRREALAAAVGNARRDAEAMAAAAGGSLGRLIELTTASPQQPSPEPMMRAMAAESAADTQIVAGEQTVHATVTGVWEFVSDGS